MQPTDARPMSLRCNCLHNRKMPTCPPAKMQGQLNEFRRPILPAACMATCTPFTMSKVVEPSDRFVDISMRLNL